MRVLGCGEEKFKCGQDYFLFDDTDERMSDSVANRYAIGRWLMTQL